MATYVNDLRLKEIATGDESGTWGTSTNTNLELIGEALSFGTEAITTNADTHTTTVADGASDPGRAMYLKYTGTLDSACTITIAPNTISRMQFIENGTSGSQNIIISQGSGANITIPAGDTKAVYLDGAGSGAAVVDAFASLSTVDLKVQDDLTVTDDVSIGGALTLTGNGDFNGDLDVDGTTNLDVVDIDGAVDMASTLQVDGSITSSDGATITVNDNSIALSLISTDADANEGPGLVLYRNSSSPADSDVLAQIYIQGENDADQKVTYALIQGNIQDASDGTEDIKLSHRTMVAGTERERMTLLGTETVFNEDSVDLDFRVESNGNANMLFVDGGNDRVGIGTAPAQLFHVVGADGTLALFSNGVDADLNIKTASAVTLLTPSTGTLAFGTSNTERMRIDSSGNVGIGMTPNVKLEVAGEIKVNSSNGNGFNLNAVTLLTPSTGTLAFGTSNTERMRIDSSGNVGIGNTSPTQKLDVTGNVAVSADIIQASTNAVHFMGGSTASFGNTAGIGIAGGTNFHVTGSATGDIVMAAATGKHIIFGTSSSGGPSRKFEIDDAGVSSFVAGRTNFSADGSSFSPGSHNGHFIDINGQSSSGRAATNAQTHRSFLNPNGTVGTIQTNGSATVYNTSSDYRLKENVVTDWDGTTLLKQLKPSKFNFKADASTTVQGFLAHEVSSIVPQAVSGEKDAVYTAEEAAENSLAVEGQPNYQQIDHSKLVPLLVKTIQEMEARITTLEG